MLSPSNKFIPFIHIICDIAHNINAKEKYGNSYVGEIYENGPLFAVRPFFYASRRMCERSAALAAVYAGWTAASSSAVP